MSEQDNNQTPHNEAPIDSTEDVLADAAESEAHLDNDSITQMHKQLSDTREQLMRALAETENLRKRAERDRQDASQYAITQFARDLLPVADNLKRAIDEMEKQESPELAPVVEGVKITQKELLKTFEKHKISEVNPMHVPFDHNLHQAMFEADSDEHPKGTVIALLQSGFVLGERLLRPALVGVSKGKE